MRSLKLIKAAGAILLIMLAACNKDEEITGDADSDAGQNPADYEFTVMEYKPAPGQFINEPQSGYGDITTMDEACRYAQKRLAAGDYVSLGAWGGYIVVKARTPLENSGAYDFLIGANAFDTSNEPGIVWVMQDENGNGLPDDTWYELRGSYYGQEGFETDYSVTYYRPADGRGDIEWRDSNGDTGIVARNTFHSQDSYFPSWIGGDSYTLTGSRLPARITLTEEGTWVNEPFKWGYADNNGEDSVITEEAGRKVQKNYFRISDAVDRNGKPVNIERADFIKVQTAINGSTPVTGEISTEVCGFYRYNR